VKQLPLDGFVEQIKRAIIGTQGRQANTNGRDTETAIANMLQARGIRFQQQYRAGTSIYGNDIRCDFYLLHTGDGLCIEVKYQDTPGTADQKLPFLYQNIAEGRYLAPVLVIVVGDGWSVGALPWLRSKVDGYRLYQVMNLEEFLTWTIRTLPYL
jgi:hypothetical protein